MSKSNQKRLKVKWSKKKIKSTEKKWNLPWKVKFQFLRNETPDMDIFLQGRTKLNKYYT